MRVFSVIYLALICVSGLSAKIVSEGGYSFDVIAKNQQHRLVESSEVEITISSGTARVEVTAQGYGAKVKSVSLSSQDKIYEVKLTLPDPRVYVRVRDQSFDRISHTAHEDGFFADADEYQFEVRLYEDGFEDLWSHDVDVWIDGRRDFRAHVSVRGGSSRRRIEVNFSRTRFRRSGSHRILVEIPRDENLRRARKQKIQRLQFILQKEPKGTQKDLKAKLKSLQESLHQ